MSPTFARLGPVVTLFTVGILLFPVSGTDDKYITYWSAHALANLGEMVNYNGERVEQSSSLTHVLLLAALAKLVPLSMSGIGWVVSVAFGLATDYGVFLLTRIKEAYTRGESNTNSVAYGLERTGRIVTQAAILFCVAIGAFATSSVLFIKEIGLGTALAIIIDASVIRAFLVPSLMALLGRRNWWAPGPLRRLHNRIGLSEG